jgi:hypothetical protein
MTKRLALQRLLMTDRLRNLLTRRGGFGALAFVHLKSQAGNVWVLACAIS